MIKRKEDAWELEMKLQKKDVWKLIENRKDRGVYIYHSKKKVKESFVGKLIKM